MAREIWLSPIARQTFRLVTWLCLNTSGRFKSPEWLFDIGTIFLNNNLRHRFFFDDVRPLPYINCLEGVKIPGISGKEYQVEISSNFFMPFPPDPPHLRVASLTLSFVRLWLSSQALVTYCGSLEGDTKNSYESLDKSKQLQDDFCLSVCTE